MSKKIFFYMWSVDHQQTQSKSYDSFTISVESKRSKQAGLVHFGKLLQFYDLCDTKKRRRHRILFSKMIHILSQSEKGSGGKNAKNMIK